MVSERVGRVCDDGVCPFLGIFDQGFRAVVQIIRVIALAADQRAESGFSVQNIVCGIARDTVV